MKVKITLSVILAILLVLGTTATVLAAMSKSNSLYITGDGLRANGNGVTTDNARNVTWVRVTCTLSLVGGGTIDGPYTVTRGTPGSVAVRTSTMVQYHRGERLVNTCIHQVIYGNVIQPSQTTTAYITVP